MTDTPGTFVSLYTLDLKFQVSPDHLSAIDAAVSAWVDSGGTRDTLLDLETTEGMELRVLASRVNSWMVSTPAHSPPHVRAQPGVRRRAARLPERGRAAARRGWRLVTRVREVRITEADADRAWDEWGANCGPGALAGMLGLTFDQVRPHLAGFEGKGYTNPTLMYAALDSLGVRWSKLSPADWPSFGLVRVRWTGPWKYWWERERHTHWIGTHLRSDGRAVFDFNALNNGSGWLWLADWERVFVPWITEMYDRADGGYEIANGIELG